MCAFRRVATHNGASFFASRRRQALSAAPRAGRICCSIGSRPQMRQRMIPPQAARVSAGLLLERTGSPPSTPAGGLASSTRTPVADHLAAAQHDQHAGSPGQQEAYHTAHLCFAGMLAFLAVVVAGASSSDWYLDAGCFGAMYAAMWWAVSYAKVWRPSPRSLVLLMLLPVMHMLGATGMYHWELGNLSWDVLVHLTNGFIGTLLLHSLLMPAPAAVPMQAAARQPTAQQSTTAEIDSASAPGAAGPRTSTNTGHATSAGSACSKAAAAPGKSSAQAWTLPENQPDTSKDNEGSASTAVRGASTPAVAAWLQLAGVAALLLVGTSLIEVVEWAGGMALERPGEGMFFRGAGDFCTAAQPCSESVDAAKDMVDNVAGMLLALLAIATSHTPPVAQAHAQAAQVGAPGTGQTLEL